MEKMVKDQGKETGGPWDCHYGRNFYGWEAERVVAVRDGTHIIEQITRARTHLVVILVGYDRDQLGDPNYAQIKDDFQQAADEGLAEQIKIKEDIVNM